MSKEEMNVVMEVGVFEELDIDDPTKKKVKKSEEELDQIIQESIQQNLATLE